MKIAGVWSGHDCSFCVLENGVPIVHAEYERYIREKEPAGDSVQFLLDEYEDFADIKHFVTCHPANKLQQHSDSYKQLLSISKKNQGQIHIFGHHQSHAANAFFSSNHDKSLIITIDGGGWESENEATAFTIW